MIKTKRLNLIPFEDAHFQAILSKDLVELGKLLNTITPTQWTTFSDMEEALPFFYDMYLQKGTMWGSFFVVHLEDRELLGTCGFKGSPNEEGMVEIGYEIREDYRLQGLATETAKGLIAYAFEDNSVKKVWAHTLAFANPSSLMLKKLEFNFLGQFEDPEDGDIWRWEYLMQ
jgi:[ribosomal protein S5]-alanine N-acetyltransferase